MAVPAGEVSNDPVHENGIYLDLRWCPEPRRIRLVEDLRAMLDRAMSGEDSDTRPASLAQVYPRIRKLLLDGRHDAHVRVIEAAARNSGFIDRDRVYRLIGRDQGRRLNGFTRPVVRACDELCAAGILTEDAPQLLVPAISTPGRAAGVMVPPEIVMLFRSELAA